MNIQNNTNYKQDCECGCGIKIWHKDKQGRVRRFEWGHGGKKIKSGEHLSPDTQIKKGQHFNQATEFKFKTRRYINKQGYVMIYRKDHPCAFDGGYILEHHFVFELFTGICPKGKHIHHKNGDRQDNRIVNLEMLEPEIHGRMEAFKGWKLRKANKEE
jgi:hypothetical protein